MKPVENTTLHCSKFVGASKAITKMVENRV
jgi:hypothetical protein